MVCNGILRYAAHSSAVNNGFGGATKVALGAPVPTDSFATEHRQYLGDEVVDFVWVVFG